MWCPDITISKSARPYPIIIIVKFDITNGNTTISFGKYIFLIIAELLIIQLEPPLMHETKKVKGNSAESRYIAKLSIGDARMPELNMMK